MRKIIAVLCILVLIVSIGTVSVYADNSSQNQRTYSLNEFNPKSVANLSDYGVKYDLQTGEATVFQIDKTNLAMSASSDGEFQDYSLRGHTGSWTRVTNTTSRPYSRICQINMWDENNKYFSGSGSMVTQGVVLTAAHNFEPTDDQLKVHGEPVIAKLLFGINGKGGSQASPTITVDAYSWSVNAEWAFNKNVNYDYAVIDVPYDSAIGYFGYTTAIDTSEIYHLSGYPNETGTSYQGYIMYTDSGYITKSYSEDATTFKHGFNCGPGVSGAPIYNDAGRVVGIHTWGNDKIKGGDATKINLDVIALINSI